MPDEFLDDDHGTLSSEFIFAEAVPDGIAVLPQALWIGVRPGYGPDGQRMPEPTVWIQYQERYMNSRLTGLVAMSPESWDKIDAAVRWRIAGWRERSEPVADDSPDPDSDRVHSSTMGSRPVYAQPQLPLAFPDSDGDSSAGR